MGESLIPNDVQVFLLTRIDSIAHLEALLLLRTDPALVWNVDMLAKRLYISPQETIGVLERLRADGFVIIPEGLSQSYQYQPASSELAHMVNRVAELYATYLIPVTNLIHTKPRTRVQEFADAFKLRKDETHG
jgi:hypothetical protein